MLAVLKEYPQALTIFVQPRTAEELERRLRNRGTESEEVIRRRLEEARREISCAGRYRYQVINDDVDRAVREICDILTQSGE
jgi:guanylate kinase